MRQRHLFISIFLLAILSLLIPMAAPASGLGAPSLTTPGNGTFVTDNTPTFRWTSVASADNYALQYSTESSFPATRTITLGNLRENFIKFALVDNTYYWRVRAGRDDGDVGPWSSMWYFTLDTQPPVPPFLTNPENNSYIGGATLELSWSTVGGAASYRLLFDNDSNFSSPAENRLLTEPRYVMSLPADGRYFWKVASRDSAGNEAYSHTWVATVDNGSPTAPTLISPAEGENINDKTPLLTWGAALDKWGIENYEIWIDNSLSKVATDNVRTSENVPELSDGLHRWRVRVFDHAGNENSSVERSFFVDTVSPPSPAKSTPSRGTRTSSKTVTFQWANVSDRGFPAARYELWVDDDSGFGSPVILENVIENSMTKEISNGNYYWRVRAFDSAGNASGFENSWTLLVDNTPPPRPSLTWPKEGVEENTSKPTFQWTPVEDISGVTYELQVDDDNSFSSPVFYTAFLGETQYTAENFLPDDNYYWRVRAQDNLGHLSDWSDNVRFEVILRDFSIIVSPTVGSVQQGGLVMAMVVLTKVGSYGHLVNLSVSGQPSGVRVFTDAAGIPPFSSVMYVMPNEGAPVGHYVLTIKGSDSYGRVRTCEFSLTVLARPTATIQHMSAGEAKAVEIKKANVVEFEMSVQSAIENVAIYVGDLETIGVAAPRGTVYSYFNVEAENLSDDDLSSLNIKFEVLRSWLQQNSIDPSQIRLWRYGVDGWQELPTQKVDEGAVRIYFSASSPGFSVFAIAGERVTEFPSGLVLAGVVVLVVALVVIFLRRGKPSEEKLAPPKAVPEKSEKEQPRAKEEQGEW